jgi:two-component system nitrogen regulation response regulator NtrX
MRLRYDERYRMIGESGALAPVRESIARAAPTRASVLITGESGVGKELVARAIHRNSPRKDAPFIRVNCAAIPEELIESELFGHEKGSFTGASRDQQGKFVQADGGTIFLDEIGDMSLKTQAKVLRVLQDGEVEPVGAAKPFTVDVRVIAATNHDLETAIAKGQFREDLYYRLNVVPIHVPPLRERSDDVVLLVREFAEAFRRENNARPRAFSPAALERLARLPWTGNVRELKNAVERVLILSDADPIEPRTSSAFSTRARAHPFRPEPPEWPRRPGNRRCRRRAGPVSPSGYASLQDYKDAAERAYIIAKLRENDWNITQTAVPSTLPARTSTRSSSSTASPARRKSRAPSRRRRRRAHGGARLNR